MAQLSVQDVQVCDKMMSSGDRQDSRVKKRQIHEKVVVKTRKCEAFPLVMVLDVAKHKRRLTRKNIFAQKSVCSKVQFSLAIQKSNCICRCFHMGGLSYRETNLTVDSEMSFGPRVNLLVHLLQNKKKFWSES